GACGHERHRDLRRLAISKGVLELDERLVEADGSGAGVGECDRPLARPATEFEHVEAVDIAEHAQLRLRKAPRPPCPRPCGQVVAVQRLVVLGIGVPELAVVPLVLPVAGHAESMSFSRASFCFSRCFFHSLRSALCPALAALPAAWRLASISSASAEKVSPMLSKPSSNCLAVLFQAS